VVVRTDAEARAVVEDARRAGAAVPELGLLGGDLCRTLGGTGDAGRLRSGDGVRIAVDLGAALVDGRLHWFVAHLVARRSWWRGRVVAVMNAEYLGGWDVAPRAHPGDGLLDVVDALPALTVGDRWKARTRLPSGTHLPHPSISERRVAAIQFDLSPPLSIWLDGELLAPAHALSVRVEPDAVVCVV
jgi:diacylglycerol kinase family enzyme